MLFLGDGLWVLLVRPAKGEMSASSGMPRSLFNPCLGEPLSIKAAGLAVAASPWGSLRGTFWMSFGTEALWACCVGQAKEAIVLVMLCPCRRL